MTDDGRVRLNANTLRAAVPVSFPDQAQRDSARGPPTALVAVRTGGGEGNGVTTLGGAPKVKQT